MAGGRGTRGKPFTDYFPKAMIPIEAKPLIEHIVSYVSSFGFIDEVIILADYNGIGSQIKGYFENRTMKKKIRFVQDSQSGTGGDLVHLSNLLGKSSEFLLWFSDNLTPIDLGKMLKFYKQKKSIACIAIRRYRKEETGYAVVKDGLILEFKEKPVIKLQMAECLGIYILATKILKLIKSKQKRQRNINLSYDILQGLSKNKTISSFDIEKTPWIDIESPTKIERNQELVKGIIKKMKA
ncbi:MAG TPA: nucleotidyltransferase family protein [Nitrosopumilaceae archaeon]|nr:nucleotidyltransferase family protein [Nitrosopumilaceae archaeon]